MPTTVKLKSGQSQEIDLSNSKGLSISNVSSGSITYYVDYLPKNSQTYSSIKTGTLTNATGQNTLYFASKDLPSSIIRVAAKSQPDDGKDIASVIY